MRVAVAVPALLLATSALAQQATYAPPPDLSVYATTASVTAAIPQPCAATPLPDTLNGSLGIGTPCMIRPDAARPTVVQRVNVVTDASGNWVVAWARSFTGSSPIVNPLPVNAGSMPIMCNVVSRSATMASGKCWQANTNTLPGTLVALGGLILNAFSSGAANVSVMVIAGEPTQ